MSDGLMEQDDLIGRLRNAHNLIRHSARLRLDREAADRITTLEARLREAEATIGELREGLERAIPYIRSQNGAEHMMDGFGPRKAAPSDDDLRRARTLLKDTDHGRD